MIVNNGLDSKRALVRIGTKQVRYIEAAREVVHTINPRQTDIHENLLRVLLQMPTGIICILLCVYRTRIKVTIFHEREVPIEYRAEAAKRLIRLNEGHDDTVGYGFSGLNCLAFSEDYLIRKKDPEEDDSLRSFYERVFVTAPANLDGITAAIRHETISISQNSKL